MNANLDVQDIEDAEGAASTAEDSVAVDTHDLTVVVEDVASVDAVSERIAAWRAQGADKRDPARFHRIEALAQRARTYQGDVRRVLDARLKALVDDFSTSLGSAEVVSDPSADVSLDVSPDAPSQPALSALAALTADITQRIGTGERPAPSLPSRAVRSSAPTRPAKPSSEPSQTGVASSAPPKRIVSPPVLAPVTITPTVIATDDAFEDLDVLEYFRETWSKLSTDGNLRQSLAQVPENAGPLNSSHLVHRALSLMHDVCPDYLRHFLRHADALSWLEDMETTGVFGNKSAARVAASAKPSRAKAR
ncbi:DUF2894 domain-containing protein [Pandoraea sp. NPDC087047]|uniref:DUF2894 domain-containing protein n=1 Tax=Pandoraea sp. NPDC087047 TaxID=3364390 RepID=UPI00381A35AA